MQDLQTQVTNKARVHVYARIFAARRSCIDTQERLQRFTAKNSTLCSS